MSSSSNDSIPIEQISNDPIPIEQMGFQELFKKFKPVSLTRETEELSCNTLASSVFEAVELNHVQIQALVQFLLELMKDVKLQKLKSSTSLYNYLNHRLKEKCTVMSLGRVTLKTFFRVTLQFLANKIADKSKTFDVGTHGPLISRTLFLAHILDARNPKRISDIRQMIQVIKKIGCLGNWKSFVLDESPEKELLSKHLKPLDVKKVLFLLDKNPGTKLWSYRKDLKVLADFQNYVPPRGKSKGKMKVDFNKQVMAYVEVLVGFQVLLNKYGTST